MALPSRPNARMGLPANPRSHTFARRANASVDIPFSREDFTREYVPSRPAPTPPSSQEYVPSRPAPTPPQASQVRLARSMTNLRSQAGASRSRSLDRSRVPRPAEDVPPPLPLAPSAWQAREFDQATGGGSLGRSASQTKRANGSLNSWGSTSSESSNSGNSLRSYLSFSSSQTSLASEDMKTTSPSSTSGSPVRSPSSLGNSIWSRVTTAAEHLKVNVSKAIASSVKTDNGEGMFFILSAFGVYLYCMI